MTTLMVTPFAPYRDGIAGYAAQELRSRRRSGEHVEVLSPEPSAAHHHLPLGGVTGAARLVGVARSYDRVVIQYGPDLFHGRCRGPGRRTAVWSALVALARVVPVELRIHEIAYQPLHRNPAERRLVAALVTLADEVTVHTEPERELLRPLLGPVVDRIRVIDHGRHFVPTVDCSRDEARTELGIPADEFVFLSIGFLQRHKGFDRSVTAFALARLPRASLHLVGSGRIDHPDVGAHVSELSRLAATTDGVTLHNRFVSDDQFDLWLIAADAVVLPYREIWSSSVVERARLFDRPVIASDLPQLRHQLADHGFACTDEAEMAVAMEKLWSDSPAASTADRGPVTIERQPSPATRSVPNGHDDWDVDDDNPDRAAVQDAIAARAGSPGTTTTTTNGRSTIGPAIDGTGSARLTSLRWPARPETRSPRPGVGMVKELVQRLTGWQIDPLYHHAADLQQASVAALSEIEARLQAIERALPQPPGREQVSARAKSTATADSS